MSGWDDTSWTTRVVSGAVTVTANDYFVSFQSLSAPSSATLPAANQVVPGREYVIQKDASAQTVTISSTSLVDGSSVALPAGSVAGVSFVPVSPVTPFKVRLIAVPRINTTALTPVGGERAVNAEAVSTTLSRFPLVPAPGLQRVVCGG